MGGVTMGCNNGGGVTMGYKTSTSKIVIMERHSKLTSSLSVSVMWDYNKDRTLVNITYQFLHDN